MSRKAVPMLAAALVLVGTTSASAFHCRYKCCVPLVPVAGVPVGGVHVGGVQVGGGTHHVITPAGAFPFGAPMYSFPVQYHYIPGITGGGQGGGGDGRSIRPAADAPGDLTQALLRAILKEQLKPIDGKLNDIYALLLAIAKANKVPIPAPTTFSPTSITPTSAMNRAETRQILATIDAKQASWTAPVAAPKADANRAAIQRLLAEIDAKQANWKRPAEATVAVSK